MSGTLQTQIFYSDIDTNLTVNPISEDVGRITNENAIRRSIRNLLLTDFYERPFKADIGSNIRKLLFELITPITIELLQKGISDVITNYEPRANLIDVICTPYEDDNAIDVTIVFSIINREEPITMQLSLDRIR
jgi:phage baseplate assembly protein W